MNINWEFNEDETKFDDPPLNVGDIISFNNAEFWSPYYNKFLISVNIDGFNLKVTKIDKTENITSDNNYKYYSVPISYDGWLIMVEGHWPWFKYNGDNIKKLN